VVSDRASLKSGDMVRPHKVEVTGYQPEQPQ